MKSVRQHFKFLIFVLIFFVIQGCGQDYNSNSNDTITFTQTIDTSTPEGAAIKVLQDQCFRCHGAWSAYANSAGWVASGYITPGNWDNSVLRNRLSNYGGDMPPAPSSGLSSDELTKLSTWVNAITP